MPKASTQKKSASTAPETSNLEKLDSQFAQIDRRWITALQRRLKKWFAAHARSLPWRQTTDPYCIWISEIMLQQTQVVTVIPYYQRFLQLFPNVQALATASEPQVLRAWEGLGYYRRARQLHASAKQIVEQHAGRFPDRFEHVLALPGIGRYTAGAILSFAHDQRLPILEANTVRLYARCIALNEPIDNARSQAGLWEFAESILPKSDCRNLNQALMELGSQICTPQTPACGSCPLADLCYTRLAGLQQKIPQKTLRKKMRQLSEVSVIIRRSGKILMRKCGDGQWWAGMWDFPRLRDAPAQREIANQIQQQTGLEIQTSSQPELEIKQTVTHHQIQLHVYLANAVQGRLQNRTNEVLRWVSASELAELPLCITARKTAKRLRL